MNQGDICLVTFPFTDGTGAKLRPVLVVSTDAFNDGADIVVVRHGLTGCSPRLKESSPNRHGYPRFSPHLLHQCLPC